MQRNHISHNYLLNVTIQSHPIHDGCYKQNEKCLIVAAINPISRSHPLYHGTFFNVLIDNLIVCKWREIIIFAHNYSKNKTQRTATLCLILQSSIFSHD